jgi:hypothetical protein
MITALAAVWSTSRPSIVIPVSAPSTPAITRSHSRACSTSRLLQAQS